MDEAVATAQALFHAHGFDNVGVAQLAREIGIEQPSLYAAFGNKLGVFKAVVERYAGSDGVFIAGAFADAPSATEGLRRMLAAAAETYSREGASAGCLIMDGTHATFEDDARQLCADKRQATESFIAEWVEQRHVGRGRETAAMSMIALAGLSASARSGTDQPLLLRFASLAADGLAALLACPASSFSPRKD